MGRYYSGDIEGKFWFAIQSSDAADRFGVAGYEPEYITYFFNKENLPDVQTELKAIEQGLGENLTKLDEFFNNNNGYNESKLIRAGFKKEDINHLLSEYADYELGKKIEAC